MGPWSVVRGLSRLCQQPARIFGGVGVVIVRILVFRSKGLSSMIIEGYKFVSLLTGAKLKLAYDPT